MARSRLQASLEALYGQERRRNKLGLAGTQALLAARGNPERRFRSVHVAGTNGKGSVCALVERVLREAGVRTGLFTSPHLVDFRERIRVSGRWADEAWLAATLDAIAVLPAGQDRTFFEVVTALGFEWFARERVEWAVVEVGLGGRLDTTNVLAPEVCAITSIGLDHTEILGDTLAAIASEKAGILKQGVPAVLAPDLAVPAREVIVATADEIGAPLRVGQVAVARGAAGRLRAETPWWGVLELRDPFAGLPVANVATALGVAGALVERGVAIGSAAVERGFAAVRWPGRLEACPGEPRLWWDGAHNVDGIRAVVDAAGGAPRFGALVLAVSRDKDVAGMLDVMRPIVRDARLVAARAHTERALDPEAIAREARRRMWDVSVEAEVPAACRRALEHASAAHPALLTGSLFAVGEAMAAFGGAPGELL